MGQHPQHILLIDPDDSDYYSLIRCLFSQPEGSKSKLSRVTTYQAGLEAVATCQFDLCLIEYELGEQTGLELLQEIVRRGCQTPLILLTRQENRQVDLEAMKAGAADYLVKDWLNLPLLERSIRYALERRRVEIERDRLLAAERAERELAEALYEVGTVLNAALAFDTILDRLLDQIGRVVPFDCGAVLLVEDEYVYVGRFHGYEQVGLQPAVVEAISVDLATTANLRQIVETKQPLVVSNINTYSDWVAIEPLGHIQSWVGAPIVVQGEVIAILSLDKLEPDFYQSQHAERLVLFANQVAPALENAWLFEAEARRRREAENLREATAALTSALDLERVLEDILLHLTQVVPCDSTCLFLKEEDRLQAVAVRGHPQPDQVIGHHYPVEDDLLFQEIQRTYRPIYLVDAQTDPRFLNWAETGYVRGWLGVPLISRGEVIGHLTLDSRRVGAFDKSHGTLAQAFANQAAIALTNARLFKAAQEARQLSDTLRQIVASLTATLNLDEVLNRILDGLDQVVPYSSASLWLMEDDTLYLKGGRGFPADSPVWSVSLPVHEETLAYEILSHKLPLIVADVQQEPRWIKLEGDDYIRSWLGIPLFVRDNPIGFLSVDHSQPNFYTQEHLVSANTIAQQAAIAIENARLFEAVQQRVAELNAIRQVSLSLTSSLKLKAVLEAILESTLKLMQGAHNAHIFLYEADHLTFGAARWSDSRKGRPFAKPRPAGLTYTVARQGQPVVVSDMQSHPLFQDAPVEWMGSIVGLPLKIGQRVVGVMNLAYQQPRTWSQAELRVLQLLADQAAVAVENARLFEAEQSAREQAETLREQTHQNLAQITRLYELSTGFVSALRPEEVAKLVIEKVVQATDAHSAVLNLLDQAGNLQQAIGPPEAPPRSNGTTAAIFNSGQPLVVSDTDYEPEVIHPDLVEKGIRAFIGLPLKVGQQIIGVLFVRYDQPRLFSQQEVETLFILANQAAIAIENARLYEKIQQQATDLQARVTERTLELQVMYELAQALGQATKLGDIVRFILLYLYQAIPFDVAACLLITDTASQLVIQSQFPLSANLEEQLKQISLTGLSSLGNEFDQSMVMEVHRIQPEPANQPPVETLGSLAHVPITVDHQAVGLLLIGAEQAEQFGPEQSRLLRTVADQAAESIQRLQSLLAGEHRRLESLVAQLPNGVVLLDAEHNIVLANPMGHDFLEAAGQAQTGDRLTHLSEYPLAQVLASGEMPFEVSVRSSLNLLFEVTAKPMAVGPEAGGWLLVIRDVTEERSTQKRIQQQEQIAAVGQLAAGIAHDFNNILTSIIGYAELLQLDPRIPDSAKSDLDRVAGQGHRAAHLVRQILDFSRQSITEKRPLDLVPFTREVIKLLERTIPENIKIELYIEPPAQGYILNADLSQMQQVLTNLAVNARDAMPPGGKLQFHLSRLTLDSSSDFPHPEMTAGDWLVLSVTDTGVGIDPEDQPHIFEPFFTTKETGKGTGLGLAQVFGIVTEHGGYINVHSQPAQGTTFDLYLPALPAPGVIRAASQERQGQTPYGQGEVILLVEDDQSVLATTRTILERLEYQVLTASNGREALQLYQQHRTSIGLVLTDITMPEVDGITLAQALREQNPEIKVILITGYPLDTERAAEVWLKQGIVDWLQKPLGIKRLAQTLKYWLKNSKPSQSN